MKNLSLLAFPLIFFGLATLLYYGVTSAAVDSKEDMPPLRMIQAKVHEMPAIVFAGGLSLVAGAIIWSTSGKRPS
ncbi:MAG: hypothetical protein JWO89_426 [Verrucomicrobiaceae bacterium]|nr:hypothetical protein [Verrucomicrobiaceae bacterium]